MKKRKGQFKEAVRKFNLKTELQERMTNFNFSPNQVAKYSQYTAQRIKDSVISQRQKKRDFEQAFETLSGHEEHARNAVCPTCFQGLTPKVRKNILITCEEGIKKADQKIKQWKIIGQFLEFYEEWSAIDVDENVVAALKQSWEKALTKRAFYQSGINTWIERIKIQKLLAKLPKQTFEKRKVAKPEVYEDAIAGVRVHIKQTNTILENMRKLARLNSPYKSYVEAKQRHDELQSYIDKYQPLLEKAQDALQNMTVKVTQARIVTKELNALDERINKHREASADFKIYDALRTAYGTKGLKKTRIAELAAKYKQNLNHYAPLIFGEKITFSINITPTKFDILAERNNKRPADVRSLSGYERRSFILLSVVSLLPFVPISSRGNIIILDEIEAGLDEPSLKLFVSDFLPLLQSIIPNVVIITPQSEKNFYVPNAKTFTIVKQNGKSRLEIN